MKVSIVGASGYVGGELLRLLLSHPETEVSQITSERLAGKHAFRAHPNLRKKTTLKFSGMDELKDVDLIFSAIPHGKAMDVMPRLLEKSDRVIDLSADFRLKDASEYEKWYNHKHTHPELLKDSCYGIVELKRKEMKKAKIIGGAGCNATCTILALYPFIKNDLIDINRIVVDAKVGASEAGNKSSSSSHYPERANCIRSYMPTMHRHIAEMNQELAIHGKPKISFSAHAIDLVRGILCTSHVFLKKEMQEIDIWNVLRKEYSDEPFIRFVKESTGIYRYPEPKLLAGTNFCDIGFELDEQNNRLVLISAIDNLMKGAAGQAVHAMNVAFGFDETLGLEFPGLHPI